MPLIAINRLELGSNGDSDGGLVTYELSAFGDGIIQALYNATLTARDSRGHEIDIIALVDAPPDILRAAEREVAKAFLSSTSTDSVSTHPKGGVPKKT